MSPSSSQRRYSYASSNHYSDDGSDASPCSTVRKSNSRHDLTGLTNDDGSSPSPSPSPPSPKEDKKKSHRKSGYLSTLLMDTLIVNETTRQFVAESMEFFQHSKKDATKKEDQSRQSQGINKDCRFEEHGDVEAQKRDYTGADMDAKSDDNSLSTNSRCSQHSDMNSGDKEAHEKARGMLWSLWQALGHHHLVTLLRKLLWKCLQKCLGIKDTTGGGDPSTAVVSSGGNAPVTTTTTTIS